MDEQQRPPMFPTVGDTDAATDAISDGRTKDATLALKLMVQEIIAVVRRIDLSHNVGDYINSITIVADGPGSFRLDIDDRNSGVDAAALEQLLLDELNPHDYHKPLRPVVLSDGDDDGPAPGATEKPTDAGD